jgi:ectoine hydroxylase-related dioxygenase (phytanoyl-CoA dioxygenase family)
MKFTRLTEEQRCFFDDNGYLVVPGALKDQEVADLTATSDRMIEAFDRKQDQYNVQCRPGIVQEPGFHPLLAHDSTLPLVIQLLSPNIHLHTTAVIYKYPQPSTAEPSRGWHRDIGLTQDLGHENTVRAGIKVGYCLTDFPQPQSGFTLFAPGSHLLPTPLPIPRGQIDPENTVDLCLKAGDAFLFENRVFHTAAPNLSQRISKVLIFGYSYRWMGGLRDNMAQVQPGAEVLNQVDDIRRQLLGDSNSALADWAATHGIDTPFAWTVEA